MDCLKPQDDEHEEHGRPGRLPFTQKDRDKLQLFPLRMIYNDR